MNSLRVARSALRARPSAIRAAPPLRRGYADVAPDKIQLTLALPHQVRPSYTYLTSQQIPAGKHGRFKECRRLIPSAQAIYKSQDVYVSPTAEPLPNRILQSRSQQKFGRERA